MLKLSEEAKEQQKMEEIDIHPPEYYDELAKKISWKDKILLNRPLKIAFVMAIFSIMAPCLIFFFLYEKFYVTHILIDQYSVGTCYYDAIHRLPCGNPGISEKECPSNCCFDENYDLCYQHIPSRFSYILKNDWTDKTILQPRFPNSPYNSTLNLKGLKFKINEISETQFQFSIMDSLINDTDSVILNATKYYKHIIYHPEFYFQIYQIDHSKPLISTSRGPLIATDEILEWSFHLSGNVTHEVAKNVTSILYNTEEKDHMAPFFLGYHNGTSYGLFVENVEPMEIISIATGVVNIKAFGAKRLDFRFFIGEKPEDVLLQFVNYQNRPKDVPVWVLGAHFCRKSSGSVSEDYESFENFTYKADLVKMPYESDCVLEDLQPFINSPTWDSEAWKEMLVNISQTMNAYNKKFLPAISSQILFNTSDPVFQDANDTGILVLDSSTLEPLSRTVDGFKVAFLDYSSKETSSWLQRHWPWPENMTSFMLRDNWPEGNRTDSASDCTVNLTYISPQMEAAFCGSIPWNSINPDGRLHYLSHNIYGDTYAENMKRVISINNDSNSFLWSANVWSTASGLAKSGHNVQLTWTGMKEALLSAISASLQGSYLQDVPVCGDLPSTLEDEDEVEELCLRWYATGSFFPMFKITGDNGNPFHYSKFAENFMVKIIKTRYQLIPYFHTTLSKNLPLMRSMLFEFPEDGHCAFVDEQFMVGSAILVGSIFEPSVYSIPVYIPENETFYELWGGQEMKRPSDGWLQVPSLQIEVPAMLRAGHIIPMQQNVMSNAEETRRNSELTLLVALKCDSDYTDANRSCSSQGSWYVGDFITFKATQERVLINPNLATTRQYLCDKGDTNDTVKSVKIYGYMEEKAHVKEVGVALCTLQDGEVLQVDLP